MRPLTILARCTLDRNRRAWRDCYCHRPLWWVERVAGAPTLIVVWADWIGAFAFVAWRWGVRVPRMIVRGR